MSTTTLESLISTALDAALEASVAGSFSNVGYSLRRRLYHWRELNEYPMSGRLVMITGASSGLGLAAAHQMAAMGASLWLVGRNRDRLNAGVDSIRRNVPRVEIVSTIADFAVMEEVRELAGEVVEGGRLDVLVNNAGALTRELVSTVDHNELTAQVHVIAPFLLTARLSGLLRQSAGGRVITVSSGGMYFQKLDLAKLMLPVAQYRGSNIYANAKRAQVILNQLWARREVMLGFHCMHPGWADTAGIRDALPGFHKLFGPLLRSPEQGADTLSWLCGSPEVQGHSGEFWLDRKQRSVNRLPWTTSKPDDERRLWNWCVERAGIKELLD